MSEPFEFTRADLPRWVESQIRKEEHGESVRKMLIYMDNSATSKTIKLNTGIR